MRSQITAHVATCTERTACGWETWVEIKWDNRAKRVLLTPNHGPLPSVKSSIINALCASRRDLRGTNAERWVAEALVERRQKREQGELFPVVKVCETPAI